MIANLKKAIKQLKGLNAPELDKRLEALERQLQIEIRNEETKKRRNPEPLKLSERITL